MAGWIEWFKTHLHWFVFIILEIASLVMLFRFSSYHHSVWATHTNALAGKILEWESNMHSYLQLRQINEQLTYENLVLQYNNQLLREELAALKHDTTYVEMLMQEHLASLNVIPAKVVSNSVREKDNIITLDKGLVDGVRTEMGVVSGTGVVGIIYEVSNHYSLVLPVLNSHSNISVRLRGSEHFGSLKWKGGSVLDAYIDGIPLHARFRVGDIVETSGFSSVFPEGIFVGKVSEVFTSQDGLSFELKVRLSVDLATIRDVNIIDNPQKEEIDSLRASVVK
ncbi:MAG: rod shape-determining protein MreC [Bacteroidaceae bacterium]|nr:rod shape-determining protein MreC [Bacteroidaceae bacterium]